MIDTVQCVVYIGHLRTRKPISQGRNLFIKPLIGCPPSLYISCVSYTLKRTFSLNIGCGWEKYLTCLCRAPDKLHTHSHNSSTLHNFFRIWFLRFEYWSSIRSIFRLLNWHLITNSNNFWQMLKVCQSQWTHSVAILPQPLSLTLRTLLLTWKTVTHSYEMKD